MNSLFHERGFFVEERGKGKMDTVSAEQKRAVEFICERRSVRHFSSTPIAVDVC